jgi:DNA-binding SARP family transcriptional activator
MVQLLNVACPPDNEEPESEGADRVVDEDPAAEPSESEVQGWAQPQLFAIRVEADADVIDAIPNTDLEELVEPEYEILVRLLGEIRVEGGKPLRPKPTAVVAYIALHHSVTVEALEDACWAEPGSGALRKRLKDVMSECRAGIGAHHLPASVDGHYTRGPRVITDTELFDQRVARAAELPTDRAARAYRKALDLVTGKVFTYPSRAGSSFSWIDVENLLSQWELKVERMALHCSEAFLRMGAPDDAAEAALHALNALPLNVLLTETLMRASAEADDFGAVATIYRAHAEGLARIHRTDPEESTRNLYRQLCANRRT